MVLSKEQILDVIVRTRERIREPARWTHGSYARASNGRPVDWRGDDAVCWCLEGAILRELNRNDDGVIDVVSQIESYIHVGILGRACNIVYFNERVDHSSVIFALDTTIEKLRAELAESSP